MEVGKALILAGDGSDERPLPAAPGGPRHLFPIANRPVLFHGLEALRAAGVVEAAILGEGDPAVATREAVADGRAFDLRVSYADWQPSSGIAGALAIGRDFVGDEPVLVQQGAALLGDRIHRHIAAFARDRLDALALRLPRPTDRFVRAPTPAYLLSPRAVSMLLSCGDADPIAGVRAQGGRVRVQRIDGCLPCQGDVDALLEGNRRMLEGIEPALDPASLDQCRVQGAVLVHPTAQIRRTLLRGPVVIGPDACVSDAYIGPYTSIGAGVTIEGTEIEHSIVLAEAELRFVGTRLESSVIGRGARVGRGFRLPDAFRVSIGDGAEIVLR
jgi:glucose-1-phosphate thymidylyltransferase